MLRGMKAVLFLIVAAIIVGAIWFAPAETPAAPGEAAASAAPVVPADALTIRIVYGSEKQAWLEAVTKDFNARYVQVAGKPVHVETVAKGSGELIDDVLAGRDQADLVSPASAAFITLANAQSRAATGADLVSKTENVVLSPVVIAMWKPMAEALGWPRERIGWGDILALAQQPQGWASKGQPQWGRFRFGHTHPEFSNSGLQTLLAEVYAGAGKQGGLTVADVQAPAVAPFVQGIERAVVHYGSSTGFFAKRMFAGGPGYLSAAVLYENLVIEANSADPKPSFPVVAIYPKEGTFWSDHPTGIVERPWVTSERRLAAQAYLKFLMERPQQEAALRFGFRPAAVEVAVAAPIDAAHGVDPQEPSTTLETPSAEVIAASIALWRSAKKPAHVALVLDTSGSMEEDGKIAAARDGATEFLGLLNPGDRLSLMTFSSTPQWLGQNLPLASAKAQSIAQVGGLIASGKTALNDAVLQAFTALQADPDQGAIKAIVVLSDGADTTSTTSLETLLARIDPGPESGGAIRVFTIAYGKDAAGDVLKRIAETTQAKAYKGGTGDIRLVFRDIATFF
jgi:Ca-activated chloride channel family protein